MSDLLTSPQSLVLYKNRPARVLQTGERLEIELEGGKPLKVRAKDITLLHPGPIDSLGDLQPQEGDIETAWELLAGSTTNLAELTELAYGDYTPAAAWDAWQLVSDGLYFRGSPDEIEARTEDDVERERATRAARAAEKQAWEAFLDRLRAGETAPEDERYLKELDDRALGARPDSRILRELGSSDSPEKAHALLLKINRWDYEVNPYPQRASIITSPPDAELSFLPDESRRDLTHLPAFAIDDEGNQDPDDALSLEGSRLWVHVADVAALVTPDSPADLEARARGANLYLPESTVTMLPPEATSQLGLGLADVSPALSFGLDLSDDGALQDVEVAPSWVRVTRLTYAEVNDRLEEEPFQEFYRLAQLSEERRRENDAVFIELPEIKISVENGQVSIQPLPPLPSRMLVTEAMVMAGEAVARFAVERGLPFPFTTQVPPDSYERPESLADMFAVRRTLKRSQQTSMPAPHAGLGLDVYARATSPLRRYLDLVVHQQLRAYLRGEETLGEQEVLERVGAAEAVTGSARLAERQARRHWTLVYLLQHPEWRGEGVVVERRGARSTVLIPALSLEVQMPLGEDIPLDTTVSLISTGVNLTELEAYFRVEE
ncbi:MAG: RNB domain-containing ribonuclease [Candidatus Tectomicrobia bacterium]|nr:RNB domain-containing ribonuclease [Candidatus Tectomicrobia bacterium]